MAGDAYNSRRWYMLTQGFVSQAMSGGASGGNAAIPGLTTAQAQALASHLQQQGSLPGSQQRLTAHSGGASDGSLNSLAAQVRWSCRRLSHVVILRVHLCWSADTLR